MPSTLDCPFCKIRDREIPAEIVFRDAQARFIGFKDIRPAAPQHFIFTTMHHVASLDATEPQDALLLGNMLQAMVIYAQNNGFSKTGYRIVTNVGDDAGQTVKHLHFHLLGGGKTLAPLY